MKKSATTKKTGNLVDAKTRAEFAADIFGPLKSAKKNAARKPLTLADVQRGAGIFDGYFSIEQQQQIVRLMHACEAEGGPSEEEGGLDKTIATLTEAALYLFGLDPISFDAFDRLAKVVFVGDVGVSAYNGIVDRVGNDGREAGEAWTKAQRAAEIGGV
jgi:hypothetical protein